MDSLSDLIKELEKNAEENIHLEYQARRVFRENISGCIARIGWLENHVSEQQSKINDLRAQGTNEETIKALEKQCVFENVDKIKTMKKKLKEKILSLETESNTRLHCNKALWEKLKTWLR